MELGADGAIVLRAPANAATIVRRIPGASHDAAKQVWTLPLSWATCVTARGILGDSLEVGLKLAEWARLEHETRIAPALKLRDARELPASSPWTPLLDEIEAPPEPEPPPEVATVAPQAAEPVRPTLVLPQTFRTDDRYEDFLSTKRLVAVADGRDVEDSDINPMLFQFQRDLTRWALRKGRAAIFADAGLGKTFMQLEWARLIGGPVLILAPLSVARQTVAEAHKIDLDVTYCRSQAEVSTPITVTNYEMLDNFTPGAFEAVVLDESSILKCFTGKTRTRLIEAFRDVPLRLCCTATPAPNDISELANHAEFLGIMTRAEMLASFFVHDDEGWRLKKHATESFYRWLASWGMSVRKPSDLGYSDEGYDLPALSTELRTVEAGISAEELEGKAGITLRSTLRRSSLEHRVKAAADLISAEPAESWIAWCGMNDEGRQLTAALGDRAILVEGAMKPDEKARRIERFIDEPGRVLVTKPRIAGFGMNFQHCARMVFVGMNDSYEQHYQSIRRCWRFGQTRPVESYVVLSEPERPVYDNVMRKEQEALQMSEELTKHVAEYEQDELASIGQFDYAEDEATGPGWRLLLGDSSTRMAEIPESSIDLSIFSPPFASLYTYSASERDLGNSRSHEQFWQHFGFIIDELLRVTKPGRNVCVHVANLATTLATHGVIGIYDFRGDTIRAFQQGGFIYHGEVGIDKNPQAQAIRTHSKGLLFVQKNKDSSWSRPALADYILVFKKPGKNEVPVVPDVTNEEWIQFAHPFWYGIRETETLNIREARGDKDERHICPLQLPVIARCVRLWSNEGETVLSPFAGIGSEVYESVRLNRKAIGIELKPEYWQTAIRNMQRLAEAETEDEAAS